MNRIIFLLITGMLTGFFNAKAQNPDKELPMQIIFRIESAETDKMPKQGLLAETGIEEIDRLHKQIGITKIRVFKPGKDSKARIFVATIPERENPAHVLKAYQSIGKVAFAELDGIGEGGGVMGTKPNDSFYNRQWSLHNNGTFHLGNVKSGADVQMEDAWAIEQGDSNIVVCIIDSGTKLDHPEFDGRLWKNNGESQNGNDDDNNGYVDDIWGWNFVVDNNNPTDDLGHGVNIAGIVGAKANNNMGYAGLDWNCKLMNLKALNANNQGYYSWWTEAIYYAVDNGANVINMSMGGSQTSTAMGQAIAYANNNNVTVVACMMNENNNVTFYPAGYPTVIAVGATDPDDTRSNPFFWSVTSGSCYGQHISVIAPGNFMYGLSHNSNNNFNVYWGGTSQAAPHVAALAGLLLAQDPLRTPAQIRSIIESTAVDQVGDPTEDTPGWDQYHGHGRINAYNALSQAMSNPRFDDEKPWIAVYPNPTRGHATLFLPNDADEVNVFDVGGRLTNSFPTTGARKIEIEIEIPGMYFIQIKTSRRILTEKLVVQ